MKNLEFSRIFLYLKKSGNSEILLEFTKNLKENSFSLFDNFVLIL